MERSKDMEWKGKEKGKLPKRREGDEELTHLGHLIKAQQRAMSRISGRHEAFAIPSALTVQA